MISGGNRGLRVCLATLLIALGMASQASSVLASGPELTVPKSKLKSALVCPIDPATTMGTPILLVTGTGSDGSTAYGFTQGAFEAYGHPVCHVTLPEFATADLQVSVEYLVDGLRRMYRTADRKVAVIGISQGGLLPRFALSCWPDLRRKVSDVVAVSAPQHGIPPEFRLGEIVVSEGCSDVAPCKPAVWQQERGSNLLATLNSRSDETPGASPHVMRVGCAMVGHPVFMRFVDLGGSAGLRERIPELNESQYP
jgi:triacylglycerol esterase/lipase EstA (alpha/beta hydrolase family)